jgi:sulfur carrier protein ThiS adenylyltransferase
VAIYRTNVAAGMMLAEFTKWLRNLPGTADLSLNLLCGEMTVSV